MSTAARPAVSYYRLERSQARRARRALAEREPGIAAWLRAQRRVLLEPFVELTSGGAVRPELARAIARCRQARATLLVPRLAEVGADLAFLDAVLATSVPVAAADHPELRRATLRLLRDVARHAHRTAGERVREGLAGARRRGTRLGSPRPQIGARRAATVLREQASARAASVAPWIAEIRLGNPGCSLREVACALEALRVPTARGGRWGPSGVRNIVARGAQA